MLPLLPSLNIHTSQTLHNITMADLCKHTECIQYIADREKEHNIKIAKWTYIIVSNIRPSIHPSCYYAPCSIFYVSICVGDKHARLYEGAASAHRLQHAQAQAHAHKSDWNRYLQWLVGGECVLVEMALLDIRCFCALRAWKRQRSVLFCVVRCVLYWAEYMETLCRESRTMAATTTTEGQIISRWCTFHAIIIYQNSKRIHKSNSMYAWKP